MELRVRRRKKQGEGRLGIRRTTPKRRTRAAREEAAAAAEEDVRKREGSAIIVSPLVSRQLDVGAAQAVIAPYIGDAGAAHAIVAREIDVQDEAGGRGSLMAELLSTEEAEGAGAIGDQIVREWMYGTDRRSGEFINGMHEFIRVADANKCNGFVFCPCNGCRNQKDYSDSKTLHSHLLKSGFMPSYNCWTKHGERGVIMEVNEEEEEDDNYHGFPKYGDTSIGDAEREN